MSWLSMRPPTRSRASSTITDLPAAASLRAAVRPEMPAPTTIASALLPPDGRGRAFARATDGSAVPTPSTAAAPSARRRVIPFSSARARAGSPVPCKTVTPCRKLKLPSLSKWITDWRAPGRSTIPRSVAGMEEQREQVAAASRRLAAEGLVPGTAGNVSARADELVAISPTGAVLAELQAKDVTVVDLDGKQVDGPYAPTSELDLHLGVYKRYQAGAVVHTHAPMATAVACSQMDELPCVHYQMLMLGGSVRIAPYRTFGTPALAEAVLVALEEHTAALMANHGAITYGGDMAGAVDNMLLLEWACGVYWHAAALGKPRVMEREQLDAVVQQ